MERQLELQKPPVKNGNIVRKLFGESVAIADSNTPLRDALLLTEVRWINRNQERKFRKQRRRAAVAAGMLLFTSVNMPKAWETAMQVTGRRCLIDQIGYRVQPENNTVKGILRERHPGYNPIERTVATTCIMERLRMAGDTDVDPTALTIDRRLTLMKVK